MRCSSIQRNGFSHILLLSSSPCTTPHRRWRKQRIRPRSPPVKPTDRSARGRNIDESSTDIKYHHRVKLGDQEEASIEASVLFYLYFSLPSIFYSTRSPQKGAQDQLTLLLPSVLSLGTLLLSRGLDIMVSDARIQKVKSHRRPERALCPPTPSVSPHESKHAVPRGFPDSRIGNAATRGELTLTLLLQSRTMERRDQYDDYVGDQSDNQSLDSIDLSSHALLRSNEDSAFLLFIIIIIILLLLLLLRPQPSLPRDSLFCRAGYFVL